MAINTLTLPIAPEAVILIGGGSLLPLAAYEDGERVGDRIYNDRVLKRCPGLVAQVHGETLDGFAIQTTSEVDEIPEGAILVASGEVELTTRGNAHSGFGDSGPRSTLGGVLFVENIEPVGSLSDVLRQAQSRRGRKSESE